MLDAIVEEYQVHGVAFWIVNGQKLVKAGQKLLWLTELDVPTLDAFEITEDYVLEVFQFPLHGQVLLHNCVRHLAELLPIFLINETVTEHAVSFAEVKEH